MNWLDMAILCLAVVGFIIGYKEGIVRQIMALVALIVAIYFCSRGAVYFRDYIIQTGWFPAESVGKVSTIASFLTIMIMVSIAGYFIHRMINITPLGCLDHPAGGIFSLGITLLLLSLIFNVMEDIDPQSTIVSRETKVESRFYFRVKEIVPAVFQVDLVMRRPWNEEEKE